MLLDAAYFIFYILFSLISAIGVLLLIDYFIFSWVGVLLHLVYLCTYKEVKECFFDKVKRLSTPVDIADIRRKMSKNEKYTIHSRIKHGVCCKRRFGKVIYYAQINHDATFEFGTSVEEDIEDWLGEEGGEPYWKPNYFLRRKIHKMINDFPLTIRQKIELKWSVWIKPVSTYPFKFPL